MGRASCDAGETGRGVESGVEYTLSVDEEQYQHGADPLL